MVWEFVTIVLLATFKTLFAPSLGFAVGMPFMVTWLATSIGAVLGFVVFYVFFAQIMAFINKRRKPGNRQKQLKTARKIVTWKRKYPIWIFVFILPFTSIPVMACIVKKFYNRDKVVFALSIVASVLFALLGCVICSPIQMI